MSSLWITLALLGVHAQEPAWPDYRGPGLDGHAPADAALPLRWSEEENVAWKTKIWGRGWSSPVVADGRAWLTTADPEGHSLAVLCVDVETGEVLHDEVLFEVEGPMVCHELNSYASPSPVLARGRVVVLFGSAGVACLDTATFESVWQRRDLVCDHMVGPGSSPLLVDDQVVIHYDGIDTQYMVSLDLGDGETLWRTERSIDLTDVADDLRKAFGTPIIVSDGARKLLVSTAAKATYGYDALDGTEVWRVRHPGFSMAARPILSGARVLVNTGHMQADLWALDLGGKGDVTESHVAWKVHKGIPTMPTGVVIDERVYQVSDGGIVTCLDLSNGAGVWRERMVDEVSASLLAAGDRIYVFDREGTAVVLAAGDEPVVLAESQLEFGCMASPAVVGDALLVRTKTHLYRLEAPREGPR